MAEQGAPRTVPPLEQWAHEALAESGGDPHAATDRLLGRLEANPAVAAALTRASLRAILEDLVRACLAQSRRRAVRRGRRRGGRPNRARPPA